MELLLSPGGSKTALIAVWWIVMIVIAFASFLRKDVTAGDVFYWVIEASVVLMLLWVLLRLVAHELEWSF